MADQSYKQKKVYLRWAANNSRSLCIVRPTVVFGVGNRGNVYNLLNQIAKKRFLMIGNGQKYEVHGLRRKCGSIFRGLRTFQC